jgi:hypothetical protein
MFDRKTTTLQIDIIVSCRLIINIYKNMEYFQLCQTLKHKSDSVCINLATNELLSDNMT